MCLDAKQNIIAGRRDGGSTESLDIVLSFRFKFVWAAISVRAFFLAVGPDLSSC